MNEFEKLKMEVEQLRAMLDYFVRNDRYFLQLDLEMKDGNNVMLGGTTGTKIGTTASQKLSFHGVDPVIQASSISAPSGQANDLDSEARTAINLIRTALSGKGIIAS